MRRVFYVDQAPFSHTGGYAKEVILDGPLDSIRMLGGSSGIRGLGFSIPFSEPPGRGEGLPIKLPLMVGDLIKHASVMKKEESEVADLCLTPGNPIDCSLPGSSIRGIFQARILEWSAISFSRGSS